MSKLAFLDKEYSLEDLKALALDELLTLRNLIASNLGVASIRAFKDHESAVTQTWAALQKYNSDENKDLETSGSVETKSIKVKKPKEPKEKKERGLAKSSDEGVVKRPTKKMFSTIRKIGEHDGTQGRAHRWPNYNDGMTIVDVIEGKGTEPWDVYNWQKQGIMEVIEPTDEEYAERKAAWYAKHGRKDPDLEKEEKAAAKAAEKKAREEAAAAKAAEKAAEKAKAEAQ